MSCDEIRITLSVDDTDVDRAQARIDALTQTWAHVKQKIDTQMYTVIRSMRQLTSTVRTIYAMIGKTLDPVYSSLLGLIETTLYSILMIHRTMEAGSGGLAATFTIALSGMAITFASMATLFAIAGADEGHRSMASAQRGIEAAETLFWTLRWTAGAG